MDIAENKQLNNTDEKQVLYKTKGTCSQYMEVAIKDGIISKCKIYGGCMGNTQGVAQLAIGMKPEDIIKKLNGIQCGGRGTSCPDQLCRAIEEVLRS